MFPSSPLCLPPVKSVRLAHTAETLIECTGSRTNSTGLELDGRVPGKVEGPVPVYRGAGGESREGKGLPERWPRNARREPHNACARPACTPASKEKRKKHSYSHRERISATVGTRYHDMRARWTCARHFFSMPGRKNRAGREGKREDRTRRIWPPPIRLFCFFPLPRRTRIRTH